MPKKFQKNEKNAEDTSHTSLNPSKPLSAKDFRGGRCLGDTSLIPPPAFHSSYQKVRYKGGLREVSQLYLPCENTFIQRYFERFREVSPQIGKLA